MPQNDKLLAPSPSGERAGPVRVKRTYEVNVRGRDWAHFIDAETPGKAKYKYLLSVCDAWPDTTFADLTCHVVGNRPPTRYEIAQAHVELFNSLYPVGTMVRYWSGLKEGEPTGTGRIKHPATVMCDNAVAWIEGARSCNSLSHVEALTEGPSHAPAGAGASNASANPPGLPDSSEGR